MSNREALRTIYADLALAQTGARRSPHATGSAAFKGLVRFGLGALGAYAGYMSTLLAGGGVFEAWMSMAAGFAVALALSALSPFRGLVHQLAEMTRAALFVAMIAAGVYLVAHPQMLSAISL